MARTLVQGSVLCAAGLWPALTLLYPTPAILAAAASGQLLLIVNAWIAARWAGRPTGTALFAQLGFFLVGFIVLRAGIVGHREGGIVWRGVLYPASQLRGVQRVRL